jgi:polyphosphate kinase
VDRFLEHSRVYYFENACQPQVFISSADWMPRNFFGRIELAIPVEDGVLRERLISEVLAISLADNSKARFLQPDGSYRRTTAAPGDKPSRSQVQFMTLRAAEEGVPRKPIDGKARYPVVRLAPSPFAAPKRKK